MPIVEIRDTRAKRSHCKVLGTDQHPIICYECRGPTGV